MRQWVQFCNHLTRAPTHHRSMIRCCQTVHVSAFLEPVPTDAINWRAVWRHSVSNSPEPNVTPRQQLVWQDIIVLVVDRNPDVVPMPLQLVRSEWDFDVVDMPCRRVPHNAVVVVLGQEWSAAVLAAFDDVMRFSRPHSPDLSWRTLASILCGEEGFSSDWEGQLWFVTAHVLPRYARWIRSGASIFDCVGFSPHSFLGLNYGGGSFPSGLFLSPRDAHNMAAALGLVAEDPNVNGTALTRGHFAELCHALRYGKTRFSDPRPRVYNDVMQYLMDVPRSRRWLPACRENEGTICPLPRMSRFLGISLYDLKRHSQECLNQSLLDISGSGFDVSTDNPASRINLIMMVCWLHWVVGMLISLSFASLILHELLLVIRVFHTA